MFNKAYVPLFGCVGLGVLCIVLVHWVFPPSSPGHGSPVKRKSLLHSQTFPGKEGQPRHQAELPTRFPEPDDGDSWSSSDSHEDGDVDVKPESFSEEIQKARTCLLEESSSESFLRKNAPQQFRAWKKAAYKDVPAAQWLVGRCYETGIVAPRDLKAAITWYRRSAEQGFPLGQNALANCYLNGTGVSEDKKIALRWFLKAAQEGEAIAQECLGDVYADGDGVEPDWEMAMKWYRRAITQGYVRVIYEIAHRYEHGNGVAVNEKEAIRWYEQAAMSGYSQAYAKVVCMLEDDRTVPVAEIEQWRRRAQAQLGADADEQILRMGLQSDPIGRKAPNVKGISAEKEINLIDLRGKMVVLVFGSKESKYSKAVRSNLAELADRLPRNPFTVLDAIPVVGLNLKSHWNFEAIPSFFIVDGQGVIRYAYKTPRCPLARRFESLDPQVEEILSGRRPHHPEPAREVIAAYKKLGGTYGWMDGNSFTQATYVGSRGLPSFQFEKCDDALLKRLPRPGVPIGLNFSLDSDEIMPTVKGFKELASCSQLQSLQFQRIPVNDAGLEELARLTDLRSLRLDNAGVSDLGLKALRNLTRLQELELTGIKVSEIGVNQLTLLKQLRILNLQGSEVDDAGANEIGKIAKLEVLNLSGTKISDTGLKALGACVHLRELNLSGTGVGGQGMKVLTSLGRLENLNLSGTKVGDQGLKELSRLSELRVLAIDETQVTDVGLKELISLHRLESLSLGETRVSEQAVAEFKKALPNVSVDR